MPKSIPGKTGFKHPKFAPLTLDFTFKRAFANERSKNLLLFLLNAFLAEKLKHPIKEVKIGRNELLGRTMRKRGAFFDVYCEDASGARFIVEIQVKDQEHFIARTFFYLCMIISNLAKKGKKYDFNIPKLYSISFLDFDLDFGKNCTEVVQHLSMRNDKHLEVCYDMLRMTFVILPRFKKSESECKTITDKILFSMKNGHKLKGVPKSFKEKEFREIFEISKVSNFTDVELAKYEEAMMNRYDYEATIAYAEKKGEKRGIGIGERRGIGIGEKRGVGKGVLRTAVSMLKDGLEPARVARITKLPKKQIIALR